MVELRASFLEFLAIDLAAGEPQFQGVQCPVVANLLGDRWDYQVGNPARRRAEQDEEEKAEDDGEEPDELHGCTIVGPAPVQGDSDQLVWLL